MGSEIEYPPGFLFRPTDHQLVEHYLHPKIKGQLDPLLNQFLVRDCDLYGSLNPRQIWDQFSQQGGPRVFNDTDLYFFTVLKRKSPKDSRIDRSVGEKGNWHGEEKTDFDVRIAKEGITVEACKRRFTYRNPTLPHEDESWIMIEYRVPSPFHPITVLCLLRKNDNKTQPLETAKEKKKKKNKRKRATFADDDATPTPKKSSDKRSRFNIESVCKQEIESALPIEPQTQQQLDDWAVHVDDDEFFQDLFNDIDFDALSTEQAFDMPLHSSPDLSLAAVEYEVAHSGHGNWSDSFPQQLLLQGNPMCTIQENQVEMIPNHFYMECLSN